MKPTAKTSANTKLVMASLIAAVSTNRMEEREFNGAHSPCVHSAIYKSLKMADLICQQAEKDYPEWFPERPA